MTNLHFATTQSDNVSNHGETTACCYKQKQYQNKCPHKWYKCLQIWHSMSQAHPQLQSWITRLSPWQLSFLMKAVHQWDAYVTLIRQTACSCLQRCIYPLICQPQASESVHFLSFLHAHIQEILMRAHMFSARLIVVLTLYLKLGLNSTLDAAVRVWHFPGKGIFTHLSQASAVGQRLKIIWGCCSEAVSQ